MPIRFACPHCRQKLSVSSRKAGQTGNCPRCKQKLTIPEPAIASPAAAVAAAADVSAVTGDKEAGAGGGPAEREEAPPRFEDAHDFELVFDTSDESAASAAPAAPDLIAVPRLVLYLQGGLLAVVALVSLAIGLIAGGALSGGAAPAGPRACTLEGTINYAAGNRNLPDPGAVVAVIPEGGPRPDEKALVTGLRPGDTSPAENHQGIAVLRQLGGGYARTDNRGRFQVQLPARGKYLVLVISQARQLRSLDEIETADLLKLAPFFDNAAELLGRQRYQLTMEVVRSDRQLNVVFE